MLGSSLKAGEQRSMLAAVQSCLFCKPQVAHFRKRLCFQHSDFIGFLVLRRPSGDELAYFATVGIGKVVYYST